MQKFRKSGNNDVNDKLIELFAHLRSRIPKKGDEALAAYLNARLPTNSGFVRDSVRRWANGTQTPGKANRVKLAAAIGCSTDTLEKYLNEKLSSQEFFLLIDSVEIGSSPNLPEMEAFEQAKFLIQGLSLPMLGRMCALVGELFSEKWCEFSASLSKNTPLQTIAQMVNENLDECIESLEGGVSAQRLRAIASGEKPTQQEVELLATVLPTTLEELEELNARIESCDGCKNPN